jgi:hypothetical protein
MKYNVSKLKKQLSGRVNMIVKPLLNESNKIVPLASTTTSTVKSTTTTTATKTLVNPVSLFKYQILMHSIFECIKTKAKKSILI